MFRAVLNVTDRVLSLFEDWVLFLTVLSAMLALFVNVATRYLFVYTMTWPEEFVRQVIMVTTFVGCAVAVRNRAAIRIDALPNLLPWLRKPLDFVNHAAVFVFGATAIHVGLKLVELQSRTGQLTTVLQIPTFILYSVLPIMGALMILRQIQVVVEDITGKPIHK
ncbi:MAG: TRAP transporter small permease [Deferrisomatales bacterium]|nr:TRAP transporter small permease [Deferrisomatales bacterium]